MSEPPEDSAAIRIHPSIVFDGLEPPAGELTAAELALWAGRCPWCGLHTSFSPSEPDGGILHCNWCNVRFEGSARDDLSVGAYTRGVTAVLAEGDVDKRDPAVADSLPAVSPPEL